MVCRTNGELSDDVTCVPPAQQSDSAVPVMAAEEQLGEDVKPPAVDSTAEDEVTTGDSAADDGAAEQLDGRDQMTEPETAAQPGNAVYVISDDVIMSVLPSVS